MPSSVRLFVLSKRKDIHRLRHILDVPSIRSLSDKDLPPTLKSKRLKLSRRIQTAALLLAHTGHPRYRCNLPQLFHREYFLQGLHNFLKNHARITSIFNSLFERFNLAGVIDPSLSGSAYLLFFLFFIKSSFLYYFRLH